MSPARITVRVNGIQELLTQLRDDPVHAKPWTDALHAAVKLSEDAMRKRAPGESTKALMRSAYQKREVPLWGRVRIPNRIKGKARNGQPFRVLGALHGSKRIEYHYRQGPLSGMLTYQWFELARSDVAMKIVGLISQAEREIVKRWGKRG